MRAGRKCHKKLLFFHFTAFETRPFKIFQMQPEGKGALVLLAFEVKNQRPFFPGKNFVAK
jgi:hypothetical protein